MWYVSFLFLWFFVLIIPWETNFAIAGLTSLAKILGICAFLSTLVYAVFSGRFRFSLCLLWVALFVAWCFASSEWEISPGSALSRTITFSQLLMFAWIVFELADSPKRLKWLMRAYILGTAMIIGNMFLGYFHAGVAVNVEEQVRFTAENVDANGFAYLCSVAILFAFHLVTRRERTGFELPSWFYWGFIVAATVAVPLSGSRAGVISLGIAGFVILLEVCGTFTGAIAAVCTLGMVGLLFSTKRGLGRIPRKVRRVLAASVVLAAILAMRFVAGSTWDRFTQGTSSNTFLERWNAWMYGLQAWAKTPFLGVGAGSYPEAMVQMGYRKMPAHNTFISVLVENGLVGFALYFLFWGTVARRIMLLPKADRFFWLGVFAAFLPALLSGSAEYWKPFWFFGAMALCQQMNCRASAASRRRAPARSPAAAGLLLSRLPRPRLRQTGTDDRRGE